MTVIIEECSKSGVHECSVTIWSKRDLEVVTKTSEQKSHECGWYMRRGRGEQGAREVRQYVVQLWAQYKIDMQCKRGERLVGSDILTPPSGG